MDNFPLITIVAICYNHAQYCEETLDSILKQTYSNIELIIIDDCSKDNSTQVISNWIKKNNVDCTFIQHKENKGLLPTVNEGLHLAKGKYFQEVACDDILLPQKIAIQVNELQEANDENIAVIFSDAYLIDDNSLSIEGMFIDMQRTFKDVPSGNIYKTLLEKNFIPAMSVLTNTNYFKNIGGYDESIAYEDYDKWLRLAKKRNFLYSNYASAKYRLHSTNMHKTLNFHKHSFYVYLKHLEEPIAQRKLTSIVELLYREKQLSKDIFLAFKKVPANKLLKFCIQFNLPYSVYLKTAKIIKSIVN